MAISRLEYLFTQYVNQKCTVEEDEELMILIAQPENAAAVQALVEGVMENTRPGMMMTDKKARLILKNIFEAEKELVAPIKKKLVFVTFFRVAAAAIILLLLTATYWFVEKRSNSRNTTVFQSPAPILLKDAKAVLVTADGRTISLDNIPDGKLAEEGNMVIYKKDRVLEYVTKTPFDETAQVMQHILSTPGGGQYAVLLPDGTKVWLNAKSQLRFPTTFTSAERNVELTGEAYFEVAKNKEKPFKVHIDKTQVEVLGTHFNVNGYREEKDIVTSLIEGSVMVTKGALQDLLKPGQQAILNRKEDHIKIADADLEEVVAWKNGLFQFNNADIPAILREVGRWYNMEIVYKGKWQTRRFQGKISRNAPLSEVVKIFELSKIKLTVEGKKIVLH